MDYDVTIAIPVYNAEKYLSETMLSALAQDYASVEYLILDDCGTDGSMDIIRQLQCNHDRGKDIRIVRQPKNMGIGAARNRILDEAHGEFLYFLDADDVIEKETVSLLMAAARQHAAQWVRASHVQLDIKGSSVSQKRYVNQKLVFSDNESFATYYFTNIGHLATTAWNVLMSLELIRESGIRFLETNYWEDLAFTYKMVTYVDRAVFLPEVTYSYYCRENTLANYQYRQTISKKEVLRNAATIDAIKSDWRGLLQRSYFPAWLNSVLMTDFSVVTNVIRKRNNTQPYISDSELRDMLHSPLSFWQTIRYGGLRQLMLWIIGKIPPSLCVAMVKNLTSAKTVLLRK